MAMSNVLTASLPPRQPASTSRNPGSFDYNSCHFALAGHAILARLRWGEALGRIAGKPLR